MIAGPHETPKISTVELLAAREIIVDAFDTILTEEEKWIINATVIEKLSVRTVAAQIGAAKTTVCRIRDRGLTKLRKQLENNQVIQSAIEDLNL